MNVRLAIFHLKEALHELDSKSEGDYDAEVSLRIDALRMSIELLEEHWHDAD